MIDVPAGAPVLLATQPIDFRKGAHSLAALARNVLAEAMLDNAANFTDAHQRAERPRTDDLGPVIDARRRPADR
jgi:hypothetical protein